MQVSVDTGSLVSPQHAEAALETLPDLDEAAELADGFKMLGDPNRVRILFALVGGGELCVGDIAAVTGISETTVSHGLRLLRGAGIVRNRRDGRLVHYRLDDDHVRQLLELSRAHGAHRTDDEDAG